MVLITKRHFSHINKERPMIHESADATYCTFVKDEKKYFQIDREMAIELVELLQREFNLRLR